MQSSKMPGSVQGVQLNYKAIIVATVAALGVVYALYSMGFGQGGKRKEVFTQDDSGSWKTSKVVEIPDKIKDKAKEIKIEERTLTFTSDGKKMEVFARTAAPGDGSTPKFTVLLLHGMAFSSQNWQDIGTINLIAAMGYRALAVDLPGFGKSPKVAVEDRAGFIRDLVKSEKLAAPVVVSPSMSGSYAIPYMSKPSSASCGDRLLAYIPVAPALTDTVKPDQYKQCKIPTLIVYGSKDTGIGYESREHLVNLPNSRTVEIQGAGHPAYIHKPDEWSKQLYNFLKTLEK